MSLRGLHTFIFETAHYRRLREGFMPLPLCRFRGVHFESNSFSTSAGSQMQWQWQRRRLCEKEGRVGKMAHDAARSWPAKRGNPDVHGEVLARGQERGRWRGFYSSALQLHEPIVRPSPGTGITIHFEDSKGQPLKTIEANKGDNILDLAHEYDIDLEGACEGSVACSTCHVILTPQHYDMLPEPEDDENDMLDMAFGLTDTSRLGCQVKVTPDLDGMVVKLPSATRNMFVDGVKPTKH